MMKILLLLLSLSLITPAYADSMLLNQGDKAPFAGFLLSPDKVKELRNDSLDLDLSKRTNDQLQLEITDYQKRLDLYQKQNDSLSEQLQKTSPSVWEKLGFFVLGSAVTTVMAFGAVRAVK